MDVASEINRTVSAVTITAAIHYPRRRRRRAYRERRGRDVHPVSSEAARSVYNLELRRICISQKSRCQEGLIVI